MNGKVGALKHCQFCNGNHNYTGCSKRDDTVSIGRSHETLLRNTNPDQEDSLRERIMETMPFSNGPDSGVSGGVFQSLPQEHYKSNFVIHEASYMSGMPQDQLTGMIFSISILGKDAEVIA